VFWVTGAKQFAGKVIVVTGAAGGIGQVVCQHLAGEGASIGALDRSSSVLAFADALRAEGAPVEGRIVDIADADATRHAIAGVRKKLGPIDVLINNAGFSGNPTLARTDPAGWRSDVEGNLGGAYHCVHAIIGEMVQRRRGAIVNVGSVNALGALGDPAYSAAKAGIVSLTRAIALEYGRYGIRANVVLPGTVRTPIWQERVARDPQVLKTLERWYPLGRIVEPVEVARAIAFLASEAASAITGAALPVDCGLTAGNLVMARELTLEDF
jgi:NAD(P)-dependent dehydrogenase (short-subunit alcohol dehydrogenase family)